MKKRGISSQIFVYIFILFVIGIIFVYGFNVINKLRESQEQAKFITFKADLTTVVNSVYYKNKDTAITYSKFSSNKPLTLPRGIDEICFENSNVRGSPPSQYFKEFTVDNLVSSEPCIDVKSSSFSFRLTNIVIAQETFVEISPIQ